MPFSKIILIALSLSIPAATVGGCATTRSKGSQVEDQNITSRVGRRLVADPDVSRYRVDVDTLQGVVTLRGKVPSDTMKASAEKIAGETDGVKSVVNELVVDDQKVGERIKENATDARIRTGVGAKLTVDDDVRRRNVDIDVVDGVVTLSGIVHNDAEKAEAERRAREVEGVKDVRNDLKVEQEGGEDSDKMAKPDLDNDRDQVGPVR
ncbi:MAG: BON domain-containing protein [Deltaproteobacteria bacterium]|nr:BON domain-containing protein [Nannocystaceae bacterium]